MACHCAETLCAGGEKSLEILGLYVANDIIQKTESLHPLHRNIYERLVQNNPASSVWIIDASRLEQEEMFAYRGYTAPQRTGIFIGCSVGGRSVAGLMLTGNPVFRWMILIAWHHQ